MGIKFVLLNVGIKYSLIIQQQETKKDIQSQLFFPDLSEFLTIRLNPRADYAPIGSGFF